MNEINTFQKQRKLQRINSLSHSNPQDLKTSVLSEKFLKILKIFDFQSSRFKFKTSNKRGDIPILILVIGIIILCMIALMSFYISGKSYQQKINSVFSLSEIYNLVESAKFSGDDLLSNYENIRKEGDSFIAEKKYFEGNEISMEIKYSSSGNIPEISETKQTLIYSSKVSPEFQTKLISISNDLGIEPNYLMAAMAFETGESFSPSEKNKLSGATGLIQFMPNTAVGLGTSTDELAKMSAEQQLDYVKKYFLPYKGKLSSLEDVYMAILWPKAVGQSNDYVLFSLGSLAYTQNIGLDINKDGKVTKYEAASKPREKLEKAV